MTEGDLEVLSRFEAVWARVMSGKSEEARDEAGDMELLLCELDGLRGGYMSLARCASGRVRSCLLALARETGELLGRLQTAYFLETGDIFLTKELPKFASCTPYNLRKLWKNAIKLADRLQRAQGLQEEAETIRRQADTLRELVGLLLR